MTSPIVASSLTCRRWQSRDLAVMLLGGPGGSLLQGVQVGALGCFGTAVQEHEFSRTDILQVFAMLTHIGHDARVNWWSDLGHMSRSPPVHAACCMLHAAWAALRI